MRAAAVTQEGRTQRTAWHRSGIGEKSKRHRDASNLQHKARIKQWHNHGALCGAWRHQHQRHQRSLGELSTRASSKSLLSEKKK